VYRLSIVWFETYPSRVIKQKVRSKFTTLHPYKHIAIVAAVFLNRTVKLLIMYIVSDLHRTIAVAYV